MPTFGRKLALVRYLGECVTFGMFYTSSIGHKDHTLFVQYDHTDRGSLVAVVQMLEQYSPYE